MHSKPPADVHRADAQYLYRDAQGFVFMDNESFEQTAVSADILGQAILLALVIGIIGGALPAIKAARMPLIKAMRAMS